MTKTARPQELALALDELDAVVGGSASPILHFHPVAIQTTGALPTGFSSIPAAPPAAGTGGLAGHLELMFPGMAQAPAPADAAPTQFLGFPGGTDAADPTHGDTGHAATSNWAPGSSGDTGHAATSNWAPGSSGTTDHAATDDWAPGAHPEASHPVTNNWAPGSFGETLPTSSTTGG